MAISRIDWAQSLATGRSQQIGHVVKLSALQTDMVNPIFGDF